MEQEHITDLIPAYALGALDENEVILVSKHLASCAICQAELEFFQRVADHLAFAVPQVAPPDHLKENLLLSIEQPATKNPERGNWWTRFVNFRFAPVLVVLAIGLALFLSIDNLLLRHLLNQEVAVQTNLDVKLVALTGSEIAPNARGILVIADNGQQATLVVDELAHLDDTMQYQLWLIDPNNHRDNGGVFSVDQSGHSQVEVIVSRSLFDYAGFGITVEPAGGSPGPTGKKVLGGSF